MQWLAQSPHRKKVLGSGQLQLIGDSKFTKGVNGCLCGSVCQPGDELGTPLAQCQLRSVPAPATLIWISGYGKLIN